MIPFEYLDHTADIKFRAYGATPEEMLSNAGAALFKVMVDPSTVNVNESWKVELEALNLEQLAYAWLSEIVFLFETESAVFARFDVKLQKKEIESESWMLRGVLGGERIDLSRHSFENEVKAVTWHEFQIKDNGIWCLQVVLDV